MKTRPDLDRNQKTIESVKRPLRSHGPGDPPEKTDKYKEFQRDSTTFINTLNVEQRFHPYIKSKYPLNMSLPPEKQKPESMTFYEDVKKGYSGEKYKK